MLAVLLRNIIAMYAVLCVCNLPLAQPLHTDAVLTSPPPFLSAEECDGNQ